MPKKRWSLWAEMSRCISLNNSSSNDCYCMKELFMNWDSLEAGPEFIDWICWSPKYAYLWWSSSISGGVAKTEEGLLCFGQHQCFFSFFHWMVATRQQQQLQIHCINLGKATTASVQPCMHQHISMVTRYNCLQLNQGLAAYHSSQQLQETDTEKKQKPLHARFFYRIMHAVSSGNTWYVTGQDSGHC